MCDTTRCFSGGMHQIWQRISWNCECNQVGDTLPIMDRTGSSYSSPDVPSPASGRWVGALTIVFTFVSEEHVCRLEYDSCCCFTEAKNYCRTSDVEGTPWCYTTNPDVRWEHCRIPLCEGKPIPNCCSKLIHLDQFVVQFLRCYFSSINCKRISLRALSVKECRESFRGREYRGTMNVTISGKTCQAWSDQWPHKPRRLPEGELLEGLFLALLDSQRLRFLHESK